MASLTASGGLYLGPLAWIGLDPGSRWCGLALRARGGRLLGHEVIRAEVSESPIWVGPVFWAAIAAGVARLQGVWSEAHPEAMPPGIGIEQCGAPGGYDIKDRQKGRPPRFVNPVDVMGLAATWAWATAEYLGAVSVPRDGHGARPLVTYPEQLVSDAERKHRAGMLRTAGKSNDLNHARAAWDVAGAAELMARTRRVPVTRRG